MERDALCERYRDAFLGQPANALSSGAFVAAGVGILVAGRPIGCDRADGDRRPIVYGLLVSGIGVGSFIQHGPNPAWQAHAHDLPIAAVLLFTAADALSDLSGRDLSPASWIVPTVTMVPVVAAGAMASTVVQAVTAGVAIGLNLVRARLRPALRRTLYASLLTVAAGALIGRLADRTALCRPDSLLQGHAAWHLLAAAALWRLAPAIGARHPRSAAEGRNAESLGVATA